MKVLELEHKGLPYCFELYETTGEVCVLKNGKHTYTMTLTKKTKEWICNCPGSVYRGSCWHESVISFLLQQPVVSEPWAEWAEEASQMRMERR